ncbi:MAG TPA: sugar transferase [Methylocella sp.]|nr:sugar transferase [Methylocella sp.]
MYDSQLSIVLEQSRLSPEITGGRLKRIFDIIISVFAFVILIPFFIGVPILIRCVDKGPILFRQTRIGQRGRKFTCLKFRSMGPDADPALKTLPETDTAAPKKWATQRLANDPRFTAVDRLLRKSSLDELPQLLNVIRGDMSLVGPRPIAAAELPRYGGKLGPYLQTRPGITGLWQISGRNDCGYEERLALDADYVRNWSMFRDIIILVRTWLVVLKASD